jgi:hypothetical protein
MKHPLSEFPEPKHQDRLISILCVMCAFAFQLALCIAVALVSAARTLSDKTI